MAVTREKWPRLGLALSGGALGVACLATLALEFVGPVRVLWALPVLGIVVGLLVGAAAFLGLRRTLSRHAPRLAAIATAVAALTLAASLVAIATGIGAVARAELPAGLAVAGSALSLIGFVAAALLVAASTWRSMDLPRSVAFGPVVATALLLLAPLSVMTVGGIPTPVLALVLGAWALALISLGRAIPHQA